MHQLFTRPLQTQLQKVEKSQCSLTTHWYGSASSQRLGRRFDNWALDQLWRSGAIRNGRAREYRITLHLGGGETRVFEVDNYDYGDGELILYFGDDRMQIVVRRIRTHQTSQRRSPRAAPHKRRRVLQVYAVRKRRCRQRISPHRLQHRRH